MHCLTRVVPALLLGVAATWWRAAVYPLHRELKINGIAGTVILHLPLWDRDACVATSPCVSADSSMNCDACDQSETDRKNPAGYATQSMSWHGNLTQELVVGVETCIDGQP